MRHNALLHPYTVLTSSTWLDHGFCEWWRDLCVSACLLRILIISLGTHKSLLGTSCIKIMHNWKRSWYLRLGWLGKRISRSIANWHACSSVIYYCNLVYIHTLTSIGAVLSIIDGPLIWTGRLKFSWGCWTFIFRGTVPLVSRNHQCWYFILMKIKPE